MHPARILILISALTLAACASTRTPAPAPDAPAAAAPVPVAAAVEAPRPPDNYELDGLLAIAWSRTSTEAEALYLQAYAMGKRSLDAALADPTWTAATEQTGNFARLPPAVIVDVDETVLDTSDYMVDRLRNGRPFLKKDWNDYVQRANAPPLPGALDFLKYAASKGVTVFYVSNREHNPGHGLHDELAPTHRNLAQFGFPNTADTRTFLFRDRSRGWKEKSPRRAEIAKTHRILMLAGDNLYDFIDIEDADREKRDAAVESRVAWLGTRWLVLPNPMYGSWESLIVDQREGADGRRARLESLGIPGTSADVIANGGFER